MFEIALAVSVVTMAAALVTAYVNWQRHRSETRPE